MSVTVNPKARQILPVILMLFGTEKGLRLRKELEEAVSDAEGQLFCGFSPEELAALGTLQEKLMRNLAAFEEKRQKEE